jgi:hypothetical protein
MSGWTMRKLYSAASLPARHHSSVNANGLAEGIGEIKAGSSPRWGGQAGLALGTHDGNLRSRVIVRSAARA